jgi:hypothetical protein
MVSLCFCSFSSQAQLRDERAVRAAYVFNLTKYVEWPPDKRELWIGFAGSRTTGEMLQKMLEGKNSESRPIHVRMFPSAEELKKCDIYYMADPDSRLLQLWLESPDNPQALTVGEVDSFAAEGGMVGLVKVGDQMQIQVNLKATQRAGIRISSRLLSLAVIVPSQPDARN